MYVWRTNSEKLIKELKDSLGLDTFCLQTLDETGCHISGPAAPSTTFFWAFERRCSPRAGLNDDYERYAIGFS